MLQESRLALFLSTPDKVGFLMIKEKYLKAVIVLILVLCLAGILISTLQSPSLGISMFLIVLFSYFLLNRRYRRIISTNEHLVNFIITFILTIFGVYLGMALSKKQEREIENAQTINILKSISDDLSYSQEVAKEVYKDKLKLATDTNYIRNPFADTLAYPTFFDLYLKTESFWTKLDPGEGTQNLWRDIAEKNLFSLFSAYTKKRIVIKHSHPRVYILIADTYQENQNRSIPPLICHLQTLRW